MTALLVGDILTTAMVDDGVLTPDELLQELQKLGIRASRTTLNRWVRQGLVTEPKRGSGGRGVGRYSLYPRHALGEAAAAAFLMREDLAPPEEVARIRRLAMGEYDLNLVFYFLKVEPPEAIPWHRFFLLLFESGKAETLVGMLPGEFAPLFEDEPVDLQKGRPARFIPDPLGTKRIVLWWTVRDSVNSGKGLPRYVKLGGFPVLRRTERATYVLGVE